MNSEIISYIYGAMAAGAIGNSTYDSIKYVLGKKYGILQKFIDNNDKNSFEIALDTIISTNKEIKEELEKLINNPSLIIKMKHTGKGDNIGRDKNENNYFTHKEKEKKS